LLAEENNYKIKKIDDSYIVNDINGELLRGKLLRLMGR